MFTFLLNKHIKCINKVWSTVGVFAAKVETQVAVKASSLQILQEKYWK